jgi:hypothetical protein
MTPAQQHTANLAPNWRPVTYAKDQPEYIPLPTLQETDPQERGKAKAAALRQHASTVRAHARTLPCTFRRCTHCSLVALADIVDAMAADTTDSQRVVSAWEPDDAEIEQLLDNLLQFRLGRGPRPRVSLMLHTFGQRLQPVRLVVGDFPEPYDRTCSMERT